MTLEQRLSLNQHLRQPQRSQRRCANGGGRKRPDGDSARQPADISAERPGAEPDARCNGALGHGVSYAVEQLKISSTGNSSNTSRIAAEPLWAWKNRQDAIRDQGPPRPAIKQIMKSFNGSPGIIHIRMVSDVSGRSGRASRNSMQLMS